MWDCVYVGVCVGVCVREQSEHKQVLFAGVVVAVVVSGSGLQRSRWTKTKESCNKLMNDEIIIWHNETDAIGVCVGYPSYGYAWTHSPTASAALVRDCAYARRNHHNAALAPLSKVSWQAAAASSGRADTQRYRYRCSCRLQVAWAENRRKAKATQHKWDTQHEQQQPYRK